jgi:hypothetical protein
MAQNQIPQLPFPVPFKTIEDANKYIRDLYAVLYKWQNILSNTQFLGGAEGYLRYDDRAPADADGNDGDIWIYYQTG